jgi:hypothetical protein
MIGLQIVLTGVSLFCGMLVFVEVGRQLGRFRIRQNWDDAGASFLALEGSVFGLMGLIMAFTFSAAAARFESRRQLVVEETNDIGTAWRRLDLLPAARQSALRGSYRQYVDSRLEFYRNLTGPGEAGGPTPRTKALQNEIWAGSVTACNEAGSAATTNLVLSSVNAMIDITTTRTMMARTHLPPLIRVLLVVLPLICSVLAGLNSAPSAQRNWVRTLGFALMVSLTVVVILDLDYPRSGLIRVDPFDQALVELRSSMRGTI